MPVRPKVALLIESSNTYARELVHGIRSWVRDHDPWAIRFTEHSRGIDPPGWLSTWDGHGIIARVENPSIANALKQTNLPVIDVSASLKGTPFTRVATHNGAVVRLAISHLRERGIANFGYCGDDHMRSSRQRCWHFLNTLKQHGFTGRKYTSPFTEADTPLLADEELAAIAQWLLGLPKPVGILASHDMRAHQVLEACKQANLRVPDEVAVIGVHNDELLCDLCDPPLSSVAPNARLTGYRAADLLSQEMKAKGPAKTRGKVYLIKPLGVACRQSTDLVATEDTRIASILSYIRDNATQGITVVDILRQFPMSRTLLERKFKQSFGITPHRYLLRSRILAARTLLVTTKLSIREISERCGFEHSEYFSVAFKREMGITASQLRKRSLSDSHSSLTHQGVSQYPPMS